jgi:hypothetical protein
MLLLKNNRTTRTDDIAAFNQLRQAFSDITDKHANLRTNSTLRSSIGNRVTFKQDVVADDPYNRFNNQYFTNSNAGSTLISGVVGQAKNQNNQNDYNSNHNNNAASSGAISSVVGKPKNQTNQNDYNSNTNTNNNKNSGAISALISATVGKPKNQTNQNTNNYSNDHRKLDER